MLKNTYTFLILVEKKEDIIKLREVMLLRKLDFSLIETKITGLKNIKTNYMNISSYNFIS